MPTRLQFTPDTEWRARFEACVRKASLDSSPLQVNLTRRALLQKYFVDGVKRTEKAFGLMKRNRPESNGPEREEVRQKTQPLPESVEEDWCWLDEMLEKCDFDGGEE